MTTYTLKNLFTGKIIVSCADKALVESFLENRRSHGFDTSRLQIVEEDSKDMANGIQRQEVQDIVVKMVRDHKV